MHHASLVEAVVATGPHGIVLHVCHHNLSKLHKIKSNARSFVHLHVGAACLNVIAESLTRETGAV